MIFESIFVIRAGFFGYEFTHKLVYAIVGFLICYYDWRKNKRLDYLWVYLIATLIYSWGEVMLQFFGGRGMQEKYLFGFDIGSWLWFTIPVQAMADVAFIALLGLFIADFIANQNTRKIGIYILTSYVLLRYILFYSIFLILGFIFTKVNAGDPDIPSRRDVFETGTVITMIVLSTITIIWWIKTKRGPRKRGLYMFLVVVILMIFWTLGEWIIGQRWIEMGTTDPWNMSRANPLIEFGILTYDVIVEMGLFCTSFIAIPYLLKLIKMKEMKEEN